MGRINWGYVAGYFDGEGCVGLYKFKGRGVLKCSLQFCNTNLESLIKIQNFIACGRIRTAGKKAAGKHKQGYALHIAVKEDIVRVATGMLPYAIIKAVKLREAIDDASTRIKPSGKRGAIAALGPSEVRRRYEDGATISMIADQIGITSTRVRRYMQLNGINRRPSSGSLGRPWSEDARSKASISRKNLWKNQEYRRKAIEGMNRR